MAPPKNRKSKATTKLKPPVSVSSEKRLEALLEETEAELANLQPRIDKLERDIDKLKDLKLTKQKLISLKLSVQSIMENFQQTGGSGFTADALLNVGLEMPCPQSGITTSYRIPDYATAPQENRTFYPDRAFEAANKLLKQRQSLNYDLFRAIVFHGGRATTEEIKAFLQENNITQPSTGESFDNVALTDISSRVNYLVRKDLVSATGRGVFLSNLGWETEE